MWWPGHSVTNLTIGLYHMAISFFIARQKSHQYHPIRNYFNNAINNDDTKLFITSLFIIVDVLRRVNIEFRGWPWKKIWLLQNVVDKKSQQHFRYLSKKCSKTTHLTMIIWNESPDRSLSARLQLLQSVSNGVTTVFLSPLDHDCRQHKKNLHLSYIYIVWLTFLVS